MITCQYFKINENFKLPFFRSDSLRKRPGWVELVLLDVDGDAFQTLLWLITFLITAKIAFNHGKAR